MQTDFCSINDIAADLNCSINKLKEVMLQFNIPFITIGGNIFISSQLAAKIKLVRQM